MSRILLQQGSLVPALRERAQHALACGAMQPIETTGEIVRDDGVDFLVRRLSSLAHKEEAKIRSALAAKASNASAKPANPFLPHEPDLFVVDVSDTHFALLNKFNVIERHLLVVTRSFVDQETLLDAGDFTALAACMAEVDGLAFYNGGAVAGASQPHKHLQLVPLPLVNEGPPVPVEPLFAAVSGRPGIERIPAFPFRHAFAWIEPECFRDVRSAAAHLHALYLGLLAATGLKGVEAEGTVRQSSPYNLLATRRWMLLVPRSRELFESVPVNSLGFAGSLFVRDEAQMAVLRRAGAMAVLRGTAIALA